MENKSKVITPRVLIQMLFFVVVLPFLPLLISGRWDWWQAWVYALICILGFIVSRALAAQLFLDSVWAFLPAIFLTIVLVIRTNLEDKTLQEELLGYREYAGRVHYRLLPGVW